MNTAIC